MFNVSDLNLEFDDDFLNEPFGLKINEVSKLKVTPRGTNHLETKNVTSSNNFLNCVIGESSSKESLLRLEKTKTSARRPTRERKFPGPAGLLPDTPPKNFCDPNLRIPEGHDTTETENSGPVLFSQLSVSVFHDHPYRKMLDDLDMNDPESPLVKYSIEWVKKQVLNKKLYGQKVPFLAVVLHSVDCSTPDPILMLRDPTGELYGTLHREVWGDMSSQLHVGSAMVLKQVGVLTAGASRRQIYLNITLNNIVTVYSSSDVPEEVVTNTVHPMSMGDLCKSIETWQEQASSMAASVKHNSPVPGLSEELFRIISNVRTETATTPVRPTTKTATLQPVKDTSTCNFQLSMGDSDDDLDLSGIIEHVEQTLNKTAQQDPLPQEAPPKKLKTISFKPKYDVCIVNQRPVFKKTTDNQDKPSQASVFTPKAAAQRIKPDMKDTPPSSQVLTQAESLIFEEVLSGIDLAEFD